MNKKPGVCTFCGTGCGHIVTVDGNKITKVFPSKTHPISKGRLCVRGWNIHELLNTPERLRTPMIKKDGKLVSASYDDAISLLLENFNKYQSESSQHTGILASPRASNEEAFLLMKLARTVLKTNNISIDAESGHRNSLDVLHEGTGMAGMLGSVEEIRKAELILVVGIDITKQNPIIGSEIHKAARDGSTVVTIDSRQTQIAKLSDRFLQVKPGSNKLVLLAMAKSLFAGGLFDKSYIETATRGFEQFRQTFELISESEVENKTGLSVYDINYAAHRLASARSAMVFFSSGISGLDADSIGYIFNLFLMAGKVGREGCGVNPIAGLNNLQGAYDMGLAPDLLTGFQPITDTAAAGRFNQLWKTEIDSRPGSPVYDMLADPGSPLKALFVVDHDEGIVKYGDRIKNLDFVAYAGAFENPFMEYADVVLPVCSYVEEDGTFTNTERRVQLARKKVDPIGGVVPGWKLYSDIAEKAGARWDYSSPSDVMNEIAQLTPTYSGITYEKLEEDFGLQWPCTDTAPRGTKRFDIGDAKGTLNFVKVSDIFEIPAPKEEFPYLLMVGKAQHFWHQNNLMKKTHIPMREYNATLMDYPAGYVEISPVNAKELGVRERWPVKIVSPFGEMRVDVKISDDVKPFAAYAPYFVRESIYSFLAGHTDIMRQGEDATIPVRIEKV